MLLLLLVAAGVRAAFLSGRSIYPEVAFPRIALIAEVGEAPVSGVMISVTRPLEQALAAVPGLVRMRSKTIRGACELSLDFGTGADMREALSLVRARATQLALPPGTRLTIERQTPAVFPVLSFDLLPGEAWASDPVARARLAEWAELELKPRLARLPDVFFVTVQSGDRREYVVEVDPSALARSGIGELDVRDALAAANEVAAVGREPLEGLQYQLLVDGLLESPEELLAVAIPRAGAPPVRLAEVARVVETTAERTQIVTGGGRDGVVVNVFLRDGGRVTRLSEDVAGILAEVRPDLPDGAQVEMVYDQADLVNASIRGVGEAIAIGALLSTVVLALFLGDLRKTVVAGLAIPISVLLTLALFPLVGESLNLMSLGGLAVAIGLIIDDAIVVVENVARRHAALDAGGPRALFAAVCHGTAEVVGPIVGSSLTTVVVFAPLVLLEGVVGQFFRSLALALAVSVLASMLVSLVYSPLMLLLPGLAPARARSERRWMQVLQRGYARVVERVLARPVLVALALLVALLGGVAGLAGLRTGFLPDMDEGGFVLDYFLPVGASLQETDAACRRIEGILRETPEVASFSRRTGAELGFFATEQNTGDMLVGLVPRGERRRDVWEVMDALRERMNREVPQAAVEFIQVIQDTIADLAGNPAPLEVEVFGSRYPGLQELADRIAPALERVPGVVDVASHVSFGSPELRWRPDPWSAARFGLSTRSIADQAGAQLLGDVATRLRSGERFVDVRVRYPDAWRGEAAVGGRGPTLFVRPADASGAELVPLSSVARFERRLAENELERENQVPMVRVTAGVAGRDLGSVGRDVERLVRSLPHDPSIRVELAGQVRSQRGSFQNVLLVLGLGAGLVFLLLVLQFRSMRLALVLLLALPFGLVGALHALRLSGVALNIGSAMGLIMLVGLVVKNGIILIEYAQRLRAEGRAESEAVVEAARVRLRPILMTTIAAIAGLVPLALALGSGAELQRPLAIAVIGGLSISTPFALLVVPVGVALLARGRLLPEEQHAL